MSKFTFLPSEKEEPMKEKTIVTQEEMNALDASIASRQDKQDLLDGNTKALAKHISDEYYCCNASKKTPGGIADCSRCAIGKAGYIGCRNTGYYEIDSGRLGTSEYRDAHRKMLCTLLRIRLNCEIEPESTTKSKTVVTQPELDALDESISVWQKRVAILNEDYTKSVHKTKCPCCEHGKEIGGLSACSFCAIGKAGYIECRGTGYYIKNTIRKGTKEYRDAYRKILCKLMEIRLNCEVICPRRQRSQ